MIIRRLHRNLHTFGRGPAISLNSGRRDLSCQRRYMASPTGPSIKRSDRGGAALRNRLHIMLSRPIAVSECIRTKPQLLQAKSTHVAILPVGPTVPPGAPAGFS